MLENSGFISMFSRSFNFDLLLSMFLTNDNIKGSFNFVFVKEIVNTNNGYLNILDNFFINGYKRS